MNSTPVIVTEGLARHFGKTVAVAGLTLEVHQGEIFGFLGHNGAGKTTTVRLLNGVLGATAGTARVLGFDPFAEGAALRRHTGVLTETPALDDRLTATENLEVYAALYGVPAPETPGRVAALLATFGLQDRAGELVGGYSKGMRQRLALARALLHTPALLFLDEPTGGLDPVATRQVHRLIRDVSRDAGHTVFLCTHNLAEAQKLCDRVAVMEHGRLAAIGAPFELARDLWKGVRLDIETAPVDGDRALALLAEVPGVRDIARDIARDPARDPARNEETAHLSCALPDRDHIPDVLARLVQSGVRVYRLTPQEPALEDVYFALHGGGELTA